MDIVARAEMVEKELGTFIERRSRRDTDPDELEASYIESVRRHYERERRRIRAAWYAFFRRMANRPRELEAPQASQESPPDTTTPQSATEDPHSEAEPIQRRSWWRRMFGG